ncbi:hypothetical protein POM88_046485 [Heracleum sosnowskyi]|uniref:Uncharacterized protein n=1 Tax=Heracleum sosnowskyi TaxID=360622 RepID=A0AAD8M628_9APIA|nr:hypothetical protein POM88_046485 [Heracleum sosnowskyi]
MCKYHKEKNIVYSFYSYRRYLAVLYLTKRVDSKTRDVKVLHPTIATQGARFPEANSLYEINKANQDVANTIVEAQSLAMGGNVNGLSLGPDLPTISLTRSVGLLELHRIR